MFIFNALDLDVNKKKKKNKNNREDVYIIKKYNDMI
jgi:hypothetical protein